MKLVTSQSGKVLGDDDSNLTVLHVGNHLLKCGPLEISTGKTVIHIEAGIGKVMVFCKLLQDIFLRRDLSRWFSPIRTEFTEHSLIAIEKMAIHFYNIKYTL